MAYCRNCGAELKNGATFCGICGTQDAPPAQPIYVPQPVQPAAPNRAGRGFAIVSMIMGIFATVYAVIFSMIMTADLIRDPEDLFDSPFGIFIMFVGSFSVAALIFSAIAANRGCNNGFSKSGRTMGIISLLAFFAMFVTILVLAL